MAKADKKPVAKKPEAKKPAAPAKKVEAKPAKKVEAKKPAAKPAAKPVAVEAKKVSGKRVYHVSKRAEDGMWQVKYATGEKAIKLFKTKEEAMAYSKTMADNQSGVVLVHASKGENKGRIRKK